MGGRGCCLPGLLPPRLCPNPLPAGALGDRSQLAHGPPARPAGWPGRRWRPGWPGGPAGLVLDRHGPEMGIQATFCRFPDAILDHIWPQNGRQSRCLMISGIVFNLILAGSPFSLIPKCLTTNPDSLVSSKGAAVNALRLQCLFLHLFYKVLRKRKSSCGCSERARPSFPFEPQQFVFRKCCKT